MTIVDSNNEQQVVSYISPISYITFLLQKCPELLMAGLSDMTQGQDQLESFWSNYQKYHSTHRLFQDQRPCRSKRNTFACAFHGDEGRGKKRGNTCVLMFETCLGVNTAENMLLKKRYDHCKDCYLRGPCAKRFKTNSGVSKREEWQPDADPCAFQGHNTKLNSSLTKFVVSVLPNDLYKATNALELILEQLCKDFRELFEEGVVVNGQRWYLALTGLKGDLKWFEKIGKLYRCFNKQIGSGLEMCHECQAGSASLPFEDPSHFPCWRDHCYKERPWLQEPCIAMIPFEPVDGSGAPEKMLRRDWFHQTKVGLVRNFVGSAVLFLIFLGYFQDRAPGQSNSRDACLTRAHKHFYLFCRAFGEKAGLRSFTPTFFNAPTQSHYPWVNCKGSDSTLLVRWLVILSRGLLNDPSRIVMCRFCSISTRLQTTL